MIAESRFDGMQTFDRSLLQLVRGDLVAEEDARAVATNPHDLSLAVHYEREDTRGSFEEDGYGEQGGAAAIVSAGGLRDHGVARRRYRSHPVGRRR
ncbi:MAG TPA: hypothetical protein VF984_04355 [Actinomycetota bacterium]